MKRFFLFLALTALCISCGDQTTKTTADSTCEGVVYEINTRQMTPEGTLAAASELLPTLKDAGVDVVWLMPIYPIGEKGRKGSLGSYYAIKAYCDVNPQIGIID